MEQAEGVGSGGNDGGSVSVSSWEETVPFSKERSLPQRVLAPWPCLKKLCSHPTPARSF